MISSFDQDLTPNIEEAKGQAVEHMESFIKCQRSVVGGCGKVLSVGWLKSSILAFVFLLRRFDSHYVYGSWSGGRGILV